MSLEWIEREARLYEIEERIAWDRKHHEPSDAEIEFELSERARIRGITVAELIEINKPKGTVT